MKKFGKSVLTGLFALVIGCFSSCNLISSDSDSNGSFEFNISSDFAREVSSRAALVTQNEDDDFLEKFIIKVDVTGDYETHRSREFNMNQWERIIFGEETVSFIINNIPVSYVIKVKISVIMADPERERAIYEGESDPITVKAGNNSLEIELSEVPSEVSGDITIENDVVTISIDKTEIKQNGSITFSAKDSNGDEITLADGVHFDAQIFYKGQDVNELVTTVDRYYIVTDNLLALDAASALPAGTYQLYVTAEYNGLTYSQTFELTVEDGFETPETQVALYSKAWDSENSIYKYSYYLKNSSDVESASLDTESFNSKNNCIAFDIEGYFYCLNNNTLKSTNSIIASDGVTVSGLPANENGTENNGFVIDLAKNMAYAYTQHEAAISVYKYPNLIASGDSETYSSIMGLTDVTVGAGIDWMNFTRLVINNNILYALVSNYLIVCDISSGTVLKIDELDLSNYMTSTMGLSSHATVTDIYALEGAVYLLVSDSTFSDNGYESPVWSSTDKNIYKRGSVIKYVPPVTGSGSGTSSYIPINTTASYINTDISKMYVYKASGNSSWLYSNEGCTTLYSNVIGNKYSKQNNDGDLLNTFFPNVYALKTSTEEMLSSPKKVIAIKPKKLVIADDGIAFYTDKDGVLSFKNINRVVTIDLQTFVIDSIHTTSAKFDSDISEYLKSGISLDTIRSGGTYYDYNASVWYFDASDNKSYSTSLSGSDSGSMYLGIKEDK